MLDFNGQRVVITGGTRGIGAGLSRAFLDRGAEVWATYRANHEAAQAFKASLGDASERFFPEACDVSDGQAVESFFGKLPGPPQVVVNNAGIRKDAVLGLMGKDSWDAVLRTNLDGTFWGTKFAVMAMSRERYGRIINVVSPSARLGFEGQANYAASKAGQVALARSVSKEVAKRSITVNCVSPGFVDTELLGDLSAEQKQAYEKLIPLKRFAKPEEVASAVLFLASKEASYITGTVLEVAGGL